MVQFSDEALRAIAPGLPIFKNATIPDVSAEFGEAEHWIANYFHNALFRAKYKAGAQAHFVTLLMRAQACFREYARARSETLQFLAKNSSGNPPIGLYIAAISAWESVVSNWAMAVESYNEISKTAKAFQKGDGSLDERAYTLNNHIKHWSTSSVSKTHLAEDTIPMWLEDSGLVSRTYSLTFDEVASLLRDLGKLAQELHDPLGASSPK